MSETGDRYKVATAMVLKDYATKKDRLNRSQLWKIKAMEDDRAAGRDSGVLKNFAEEVEATVGILERVSPVVTKLCQKACEKPKAKKIAVAPATPAEPPPTDPSVHGIDLGWD